MVGPYLKNGAVSVVLEGGTLSALSVDGAKT
jgi:hypothetical protein